MENEQVPIIGKASKVKPKNKRKKKAKPKRKKRVPAPKVTKLALELQQQQIPQSEFRHLIYERTGHIIGKDRISRMVRGKHDNCQLRTMVIMAETLGVSIDAITEKEDLLKHNN
jgi:hypothetical protein